MIKHSKRHRSVCALAVSVVAIIVARPAPAAAAGSAQPASARIAPYLTASKQQEIALARSAAPPSIAMHATVMVLTAHGYVTEVKGSNGFVCLITRSWDSITNVASARYWNPKIRIPKCFNAVGARARLPMYMMATRWALAGASEPEIGKRLEAARAAGKMDDPSAGAICYMMSKRGWGVGGNPGAWRPHLMFYFPNGHVPNWGADLQGNPVLSGAEDEHTTVVFVLVPVWSDGSAAPGF